ncbi:S26 family signal peptidase [Alishewanella longhuensis]
MPASEFFMMGETITSYDSRYWGTVKQEDIIGKAYAIM